jgi:hypothetical protein
LKINSSMAPIWKEPFAPPPLNTNALRVIKPPLKN